MPMRNASNNSANDELWLVMLIHNNKKRKREVVEANFFRLFMGGKHACFMIALMRLFMLPVCPAHVWLPTHSLDTSDS